MTVAQVRFRTPWDTPCIPGNDSLRGAHRCAPRRPRPDRRFPLAESGAFRSRHGDTVAEEPAAGGLDGIAEQWLVLITCRDEQHQLELLQRFKEEGLPCKALLS